MSKKYLLTSSSHSRGLRALAKDFHDSYLTVIIVFFYFPTFNTSSWPSLAFFDKQSLSITIQDYLIFVPQILGILCQLLLFDKVNLLLPILYSLHLVWVLFNFFKAHFAVSSTSGSESYSACCNKLVI